MNKLYLVLFVSVLFLFSCKQKDTQSPLIILEGENPMTVTLGTMWEDPGATIDDNFDGNSIQNSMTVTHNIDINGPANGSGTTKTTGEYQVTYTVKDKSGNVATVIRVVKVVNSAEKYATKYEVNINSDVLEQIVKDTLIASMDLTFDTRTNYKVWFPKLGGTINSNPDSILSASDTISKTIRVYGFFKDDTVKISRQTFYIKEKVGTNLVPYLYQVMGKTGSTILDTIDPYFIVKYKIEKYKVDATGQWDTLGRKWKIMKSDDVYETWMRY